MAGLEASQLNQTQNEGCFSMDKLRELQTVTLRTAVGLFAVSETGISRLGRR